MLSGSLNFLQSNKRSEQRRHLHSRPRYEGPQHLERLILNPVLENLKYFGSTSKYTYKPAQTTQHSSLHIHPLPFSKNYILQQTKKRCTDAQKPTQRQSTQTLNHNHRHILPENNLHTKTHKTSRPSRRGDLTTASRTVPADPKPSETPPLPPNSPQPRQTQLQFRPNSITDPKSEHKFPPSPLHGEHDRSEVGTTPKSRHFWQQTAGFQRQCRRQRMAFERDF
jgi:hypothetical protein